MFKDRLRAAAAGAEVSQAEIARRFGITQPSVSAWFAGKTMPEADKLSALASMLNVTSDWLLNGTAPKQSDTVRYSLPRAEAHAAGEHWVDDADHVARAWDVVRDVWKEGAPVNVGRICKELGITVVSVSAPDEFSASVKKRGQGYVLEVNARHAPVRQRFSVAHEIAHYIAHRSMIGDGIVDDGLNRSRLTSDTEREANAIAADILMPVDMVAKAIDDMRDAGQTPTIGALADMFRVSAHAMAIRLGSPYVGA